MPETPTHADLLAQIAGLQATVIAKFDGVDRRLEKLEKTQNELIRTENDLLLLAEQGKAGLRTLVFLGGAIVAIASTGAAIVSILINTPGSQ